MVVGTVYNMTLYPRHAPKATIKTYMYDEPGTAVTWAESLPRWPRRYHLQLIHSTPLDVGPLRNRTNGLRSFFVFKALRMCRFASSPSKAASSQLPSIVPGRLLASVGRTLRIYELGKRKLWGHSSMSRRNHVRLRKCEYKNIPEGIMWMPGDL